MNPDFNNKLIHSKMKEKMKFQKRGKLKIIQGFF